MKSLTPFANDEESQDLGGLTFENGTQRLSISGAADITRDKAGLKRAKDLRALLGKIVKALEADANLPEKVTLAVEEPVKVKNPFA
jgi:hypothetical protein